MKKKLKSKLESYKASISQKEIVADLKKIGLSSSAALAAIIMAPVELTSQVVCGNMGAPTRTVGACDGDIAFASTQNCAKIDFDGDGTPELQIYYYQGGGVNLTAYGYWDKIDNNALHFTQRLEYWYNYDFPNTPSEVTNDYNINGADMIHYIELSSGTGYGFIVYDGNADLWDVPPPSGDDNEFHTITGQEICCRHSSLPVMWGAQTGVVPSDFEVQNGPNPAEPEDEVNLISCEIFKPGAVPVELSSFEAEANEKSILLDWSTESEINNSGFSIERSTNGKDFREIAFIDGKGESTKTVDYSYEDREARETINYYYRLKQIDYNGDFEYSITRIAKIASNNSEFIIAPNPASDIILIDLDAKLEGTSTITFINTAGQTVLEETRDMNLGSNNYSINIQSLVAGVYYVKVSDGLTTSYKKLVVQK